MIILPLTNCDDPPSVACRHLEVLPKTLASPFPIRWSSPRCGNGIFGMGGSEINVHLAVHLPYIPSMRCDACCKQATVSGKDRSFYANFFFFVWDYLKRLRTRMVTYRVSRMYVRGWDRLTSHEKKSCSDTVEKE